MWISIDDKLPKENQPVILSNTMDLNSNECYLGYLIRSKKKTEFAWHVGNQTFIKIASYKYWYYLLELDLSIPNDSNDASLLSYFNHYLAVLSSFEKRFLFVTKAMMESGDGFYHLDLYINGIASRSLSLLYGFETLIKSKNYMSASHLVRPHLDNYLRLFAAWKVESPHDFASKVMNGEMVRSLPDKDGKKMTDGYLSNLASKQFPWIKDVYNETSGFIHFSYKHIFTALKKNAKTSNSLITTISKYDNDVSNYSKIEACTCMIEISNCILQLIFGYVVTKQING